MDGFSEQTPPVVDSAPQESRFASARLRLGFAEKVVLLSVIVAAGTALVFSAVHTRSAAALAEEKSLDGLTSSTALLVPYVRDAFDDMRQDLHMLALTQAATAIARVTADADGDRLRDASFDELRDRLTRLFVFILRVRPGYTQIRYIGLADGGKEIIRVQRVDGEPTVVGDGDLQRKGHRDFFGAALELPPGNFAFSAIDRNMVQGGVDPDAPVALRALTTLHDNAGNPLGVIVINDDYVSLLNRIAAAARLPADVYVIDGGGNSFVAPATGEAEFLFSGDDARSERRGIAATIRSAAAPSGVLTHEGNDSRKVVSYATVLPAGPGGEPLRVGLGIDRDALYEQAAAMRAVNYAMAGGMILAAGLFGLFAARSLVRPIRKMRRGLATYAARGDISGLPTELNDEIGEFARAFDTFARELEQSRGAERRAFMELDATLQNSIDGIVTLDQDGSILRMNPASCEMFGYAPDEIIGRPFKQLMLGASFPQWNALFRGVIAGDGSDADHVREFTGVTREGSPVEIEIATSLVPVPGEESIVSVIIRNIDGRKEADRKLRHFSGELESANQQLRSANEKMTRINEDLRGFTYIVSHDLRAPLINLMGFSARLASLIDRLKSGIDSQAQGALSADAADLIDEQIPKALAFILSAGEKMQRQLDVILRLSRIGSYEMKPSEVNLSEVFQEAAADHDIGDGISVQLDDAPSIVIDADAARIIASNLVSNAVKYRDPARSIEIRVSAEWDADFMTLCIEDNGRGIRKEDLEEIFKLFRRVGRQDTHGEGIGLAFVHRIVERLGGDIRCESELARGTRFFVTLPRSGTIQEAA